MTAAGFHEGERAVQRRAGTEHDADRLSGMLDAPWLDGGFSRFLAARTFAALCGRDASGRVWVSPLAWAGMLDAHGTVLKVHTVPAAGDPLAGLPAWPAWPDRDRVRHPPPGPDQRHARPGHR